MSDWHQPTDEDLRLSHRKTLVIVLVTVVAGALTLASMAVLAGLIWFALPENCGIC